MILELVTCVLGATTFQVVANSWITHHRLRKINEWLEKGDPARFLQELDREIRRQPKEPLLTLLQINRAGGLVYVGGFGEALQLLRSVDRKVFKKWRGEARRLLTALYYNNLLYTLLLCGHFDEARQIVGEAESHLAPRTSQHQLDLCMHGTLAVYQYFCGSRSAARHTFEYLVSRDWPDMFRASNLYFVGRLDLAEGRVEEGMLKVNQAAGLAPRSYLAEEPRRLVDGRERIGSPGAGLRAAG